MKKMFAILAILVGLATPAVAQAADRNPYKWTPVEAATATRNEGNARCLVLARRTYSLCVGSRGVPVILSSCKVHNDNAWFPASYATCKMQFGMITKRRARMVGCTLRLSKHTRLRDGLRTSVVRQCVPGTAFG